MTDFTQARPFSLAHPRRAAFLRFDLEEGFAASELRTHEVIVPNGAENHVCGDEEKRKSEGESRGKGLRGANTPAPILSARIEVQLQSLNLLIAPPTGVLLHTHHSVLCVISLTHWTTAYRRQSDDSSLAGESSCRVSQ
jgi:hypothetical protein